MHGIRRNFDKTVITSSNISPWAIIALELESAEVPITATVLIQTESFDGTQTVKLLAEWNSLDKAAQ